MATNYICLLLPLSLSRGGTELGSTGTHMWAEVKGLVALPTTNEGGSKDPHMQTTRSNGIT